MRTTIEIRDDHRAKLLELAARRGEKGFSNLIAEAIEAYLGRLSEDAKRRNRALRLKGCLSPREAGKLRSETARLRKTWR